MKFSPDEFFWLWMGIYTAIFLFIAAETEWNVGYGIIMCYPLFFFIYGSYKLYERAYKKALKKGGEIHWFININEVPVQ